MNSRSHPAVFIGARLAGCTLRFTLLILFWALPLTNLAAANGYADLILEDKPAVYWRFDDTDTSDSAAARDDSGHQRHATYRAGVTSTEGIPGTGAASRAARFNGKTAYVESNGRSGLKLDTLSVEFWFRSSQPFDDVFWPGSATFLSTALPGPGSSDWLINAASQAQVDGGQLIAESGPAGKPRDLYLFTHDDDPLNDDHWHHVVWTRTARGEARFYVDGKLHAAGNDGGGTISNDRVIQIGGEKLHPGGSFLEGDMDEVAIYPHILSEARIGAHYSAIQPHLSPRPPRRPVPVAATPPSNPPPADPLVDPEPARPLNETIAQTARTHWAFQPISAPPLPTVEPNDWTRNAVDFYILAQLEAEGLEPAPEADRATLLRRATFDLTGLPPTPDAIEAFTSGSEQTDWSERVDHLLDSPHYGERYARHWLDVARYADSAGYELDNFYHHAWQYRDYVIRSFNADKPFDRFIEEQIAGDILWPDNADSHHATGFYTVGPLAEEGGIKRPRRLEYQRLTDAADTTGEAFLGLTLGCARCHDHKYDPITHRDYFSFQAIFAGSDVSDLPVNETRGKDSEAQRRGPRMRVLANRSTAVQTRLLRRGDIDSPAGSAPPGVPAALPGGREFVEDDTDAFKQRRVHLAKWITSPDNPLTARVIANRVWMWHFGQPLVNTPNDFGIQGGHPTHPQLLDHLATYLVQHGWSLKSLHRLILNSATYRMSSHTDATRSRLDPGCRLLSRFPRRRLEAEAIWDNLLATAGTLNPDLFGPSVFPPIDPEILKAKINAKWTPEKERSAWARRGIYVVVHRSLPYPFFETFNATQPILSCARRDSTVVSPQALTLLNDTITADLALDFAGRLVRESGTDLDRVIGRAWRLAFGRPVSTSELEAARAYVESATARFELLPASASLPTPSQVPSTVSMEPAWGAALAEFCLALLNANEFIYID